jgi:hypothetical protein
LVSPWKFFIVPRGNVVTSLPWCHDVVMGEAYPARCDQSSNAGPGFFSKTSRSPYACPRNAYIDVERGVINTSGEADAAAASGVTTPAVPASVVAATTVRTALRR